MSVNRTSQPANNAIKPDAPTSVSAVAVAGNQSTSTAPSATVSFTPSVNPGKGTANYVVTSSPGSLTGSGASSPITVTGLTAATAYTFTIVKQSGSGVSSDTSGASSSITAFTTPDAPTGVSASANASSGQIVVSWTAPNARGSAITNYYVDYSTSSTFASGVTTINTGSTSTSRTISSLTNGTTYYFRVRAENAAGQSTNSSSANDYPYTAPSFGTQSGSSSASAPSGTSTTSVSGVGTTTATLSYSLGTGAAFSSYERLSGTAVTPSGNSLSGLAEKATHQWRVVVSNTTSSQSLTTRVTPNGSTATVSVEYGNSTSYGTSAGSANIGAGNTEVASSWSLGTSTSSTIYWRATVSYRGGATVQTTGSISRAVSTYSGTGGAPNYTTYSSATPVFETMGTYSYNSFNNPTGITIKRRTYHNDITSISMAMVGGGAGGEDSNSGYGTGGGGGGQVWSVTGYTSTGSISITAPGAGGGANGYGGSTYWKYWSWPGQVSTGVSAAGGTPGLAGSGGDSGNGNTGYKAGSTPFIGGGGGGHGGSTSSANGGAADANSWGGGGGGCGNAGFGNIAGSRTYGVGAGGMGGDFGQDFNGVFGYWSITYVGPAAIAGYENMLYQTYNPD